jgi:hypothetical protein
MTEATLARYRDILQAKLRELHNARGKSEGIRTVKTAGDLEESKRRFDPEGATVRLSSESIAERGIATGNFAGFVRGCSEPA